MTYRLQKKALPPAPPPPAADVSTDDAALDEQTADDGRVWSGELYEGDDPPTGPGPATFASFSHPNGETAWLDRADDTTLTGWVLDVDGSLYRYEDADAWSADVDGAEMAEVESVADPLAEEDPDAEADADADLDAEEDPDAEPDPLADPDDDEEEDAGVTLDGDEDEEDYQGDAPTGEDDAGEDPDDEEEDDVLGKFKKGQQVKSFPAASLSGRRTVILVGRRG